MEAKDAEEKDDDVCGAEAWRQRFVAFYASNAPDKAGMVTDKMMATWDGRYNILYANLEKK